MDIIESTNLTMRKHHMYVGLILACKTTLYAGRWGSYNTIVATNSGNILRVHALGDVQYGYVEIIIKWIKEGNFKWE